MSQKETMGMNWDDHMREKMEQGIADLAQQRGVDIFVRISDDGTWQITVKHGRHYRRAARTIFFIEESPEITDFSARFEPSARHLSHGTSSVGKLPITGIE
jgi:hypothetical protein